MAREPMQDRYHVKHWLLFRKPGAFFYDYALLYDQRNYEDGECVIECPWLGKTFKSWLWTLDAVKEFYAAAHAAVTARSGGFVYSTEDGAMVQAFWQEQATFLEGPESARQRPLIAGPHTIGIGQRARAPRPVSAGAGLTLTLGPLFVSASGRLALAEQGTLFPGEVTHAA